MYALLNVSHSVPKSNLFTREILPNVDAYLFKQFMRMNWHTLYFIVDIIQYEGTVYASFVSPWLLRRMKYH